MHERVWVQPELGLAEFSLASVEQQHGCACTQDKLHLYFLFDLMPGGDLMDVLVAEARVIKRRIAQGTWKRACFAPKVLLCSSWRRHTVDEAIMS